MNHWKVILATALIFAAGVITGNILTRKVAKANPAPAQARANSPTNFPPPWQFESRRLLKTMEAELNLRPEQKQKVEGIMSASRERTKAWWEELNPKLREEFGRVRQEIRAELDTDQQIKFDEIYRKKASSSRDHDRRRDDDRKRHNEGGRSNKVSNP